MDECGGYMDISDYTNTINESISRGEPIEFKFGYVSHQDTEFVMEALATILNSIGKVNLMDEVSYFLREFVTNANKSNLKRVYFKSLNLNIDDSEGYKKGMETFARDFHDKQDSLQRDFGKLPLYTKVIFLLKNHVLNVTVRNSNMPTKQELDRMWKMIEDSKKTRDIAQAYENLSDVTEGTGLGLISSMLMLRSMGLDESFYKINKDEKNNETAVSVDIYLDTVTEMQVDYISDLILSEINNLPVFPEKIKELEGMLSDRDVAFGKVATVIQSDLTLTAELLRIVNSAQYMLPQKVSNITNAISLIGVKGLKNLLYSYGTQNILSQKFGKMDEIWQHSYRVASYAYHIANDMKRTDLQDDAYIGGILHDMGKIIAVTAYPMLMEKISSHCVDKGINCSMVERLSMGLSHARIGADIARRWNFPDNIVDVINCHHQPLLSPDETKDLVNLIYMANILAHVRDQTIYFSLIEKDILKKYNLRTKQDLIALEKKLDDYYEAQIRK
jgi:putative nucleotidyltransferase with HDIG domain